MKPQMLVTTTIADLEVSDKKITGSSTGPIVINPGAVKDSLEREAVANALAQRDGADVLVGFTFSYKTSTVTEKVRTIEHNSTVPGRVLTEYLTVTVTGYPARYVNFRTYNKKNDTVEVNRTPPKSNAAPQSNVAAHPVIVPSTGVSGEQSIFKGGLK
jgi:hypothetical protein